MSWKQKEQFFGTAFIGRHFKRMKLGFTSDYFYEQMMNRGMPREPYFESAFDDYYTTQRFSNSVVLNGKVCENVNANFIFANNYFKRIKNTYINDLTTLDQTLTESAADQDTTVFNTATLRGTLSTARENKKVNAEIGYDLNHEVGKGLRIKGNMQQIGDYAVFLSAEFKPFATTVIRPGVRASYNTSYSAPVIPSLNIKQTFGKKNTIRVSYARGFRAPSLKDLYFYFVDVNHNIKGNENLKAEYSHNFSLNYTKSFEFKSVGLKIDNGYFYNSIDNLISLAQYSGTEYSYFNLNKYKTVGAQLQLDVKFEKLLVAIGGTYIGRYNQLSDSMDVDPFFFSPEGRLNLQYSFTDNFVVSLFYKYTGETPNVSLDANNQLYSSKIDDYHMLDCSVMRSFLEKKITITVGAKNLMNVRNILGSATSGAHSGSSSTIPMATGRLYFLKADINLELKKNKK